MPVHKERTLTEYGLKPLQKYDDHQRQYIINHYYKFLFVRNPYERLLSAFREKLEMVKKDRKGPILWKVGVKILKTYRPYENIDVINAGRIVTFSEFLQFVADEVTGRMPVNPHWNRYTELIDICNMNFDFIGKYETFTEDVDQVLPHLFRNASKVIFPKGNVSKSQKKTKEYYSNVDKMIIKRISHAFADDFELFGYDPQLYL